MKIKCLIRGIRWWMNVGEFIPHIYTKERVYRANVFYTDKTFRVSEKMHHTANEKVVRDAYIEECRCIDCGARDISWYTPERYERIQSEVEE